MLRYLYRKFKLFLLYECYGKLFLASAKRLQPFPPLFLKEGHLHCLLTNHFCFEIKFKNIDRNKTDLTPKKATEMILLFCVFLYCSYRWYSTCYYPHTSRISVSPVSGIFSPDWLIERNNFPSHPSLASGRDWDTNPSNPGKSKFSCLF